MARRPENFRDVMLEDEVEKSANAAAVEELMYADFPPGPLDLYRKQATFDWKLLRSVIEDEKLLRFKVSVARLLLQILIQTFRVRTGLVKLFYWILCLY